MELALPEPTWRSFHGCGDYEAAEDSCLPTAVGSESAISQGGTWDHEGNKGVGCLVTRDTIAMRPTDLARLNAPYPEDDTDPPEAAAMAALGMELPHWTTLETHIFADFTEQPPYGIGWWAPDPGTSRRILIADQLY